MPKITEKTLYRFDVDGERDRRTDENPHQSFRQCRSIMTLKEAQATYVHRYTMEHKPRWANTPLPNGKFYAPQFRSDQEWFDNTEFPTDGRRRYCHTTNQTWPLGIFLDAPFA
jgi:hypothetical protein